MSAIKDGRYPIVLDKQRHMLFSLNVIDEMQDKFGGYDKLFEALQGDEKIKNLIWLLTRLLNEGAEEDEPELTERQVGRLIHLGNFHEVQSEIMKAFTVGNVGTDHVEDDDEDDEDDEKNAKAGKGK